MSRVLDMERDRHSDREWVRCAPEEDKDGDGQPDGVEAWLEGATDVNGIFVSCEVIRLTLEAKGLERDFVPHAKAVENAVKLFNVFLMSVKIVYSA